MSLIFAVRGKDIVAYMTDEINAVMFGSGVVMRAHIHNAWQLCLSKVHHVLCQKLKARALQNVVDKNAVQSTVADCLPAS